jgi:hypothetical protein
MARVKAMVLSEYSVSPNNQTDRQDITEIILNEKVEDTNGVIRSCKSKQDGQCKKCR